MTENNNDNNNKATTKQQRQKETLDNNVCIADSCGPCIDNSFPVSLSPCISPDPSPFWKPRRPLEEDTDRMEFDRRRGNYTIKFILIPRTTSSRTRSTALVFSCILTADFNKEKMAAGNIVLSTACNTKQLWRYVKNCRPRLTSSQWKKCSMCFLYSLSAEKCAHTSHGSTRCVIFQVYWSCFMCE